ncbi:hypothetical protein FA13DRAFT_261958 [Coprinellus micaceus]|uniref:Uncharacterized protein n=1 Tax=Coprinellus micaceus TaxID=71717 RepID=A0A4Y7TF68_COPMI|nr:hypothetical protein FA13DRAFT_261958 [Coprinellus micaceus]
MRMPSIELMHALQLATQSLPGALSPRLREFAWYHATDALLVFGREFSKLLAPHMNLFLGENVRYLEADNVSQTDPPSPLSCHRFIDKTPPTSTKRPHSSACSQTRIRSPDICHRLGRIGESFLHRCTSIPHPPLRRRCRSSKNSKSCHFLMRREPFSVSDLNPTAEGFPSLQNLELATESFNAHLILPHLGSVNRIETFE